MGVVGISCGYEEKKSTITCALGLIHLYNCFTYPTRQFSRQLARHFVTSSQSSLLFLIKVSVCYM